MGDWFADKKHGEGSYLTYNTSLTYEGEWVGGIKHG